MQIKLNKKYMVVTCVIDWSYYYSMFHKYFVCFWNVACVLMFIKTLKTVMPNVVSFHV